MSASPDSQRIEILAYQLWEKEGRPEGRACEHWRQAEMQLEVEFRVGFPDPDAGVTHGEGKREAVAARHRQTPAR